MPDLLKRTVLGHPLYVWLLWATAAAVLAACPMMLSEPAMWFYLLDPELLALIVIIGVQYTRLEIGILALRMRGELARCATQLGTRRGVRRASRCARPPDR